MISRFSILIFLFLIALKVESQTTNIQISNNYNPNETTIAVNPKNLSNWVAAANMNNIYVSVDSGKTWVEQQITSPYGVWGDPVLVADTNGVFYFFHLSNPSNGSWIDRIVCQKSIDGGQTWSSGTFLGLNGLKKQDKHGVAVDPSSNTLYVTWTQFDAYNSKSNVDSSNILFSKSLDGGINWTAPKRINYFAGDCLDSSLTVEGASPTIGINGEIYVTWSGPKGIVFNKSTDGGNTWLPVEKILVPNHSWTFEVPGIYRCNGMPICLVDRSKNAHRGKIFIVFSDQSKGNTDTDVWSIGSSDGGLNWTNPIRVNNDPVGRHQFFASASIDSSNGSLWVLFYDRRNYLDELTDVYLARSKDGGTTFQNLKISQSPFLPSNTVFFGDYTSIIAQNGIVRPIWTRLNQGALSVMTALIDEKQLMLGNHSVVNLQNEPLHWEAYPNPSNGDSFISYKLKKPSKVSLFIFDQNGKKIADILQNQTQEMGKHVLKISAEVHHLVPGIYYYSLEIEGQNAKKKLMIVH